MNPLELPLQQVPYLISLLDILTNVPNLHTGSSVFKTTLSDHYLIWTEFNVRLSIKKYNHKEVIVRDYENFNDDQFLTDNAYEFE